MTATGISVLLIALITAVTALAGATIDVNPSTVLNQAAENVQAVNITAGIILAIVLFILYYCGGYVAARLARWTEPSKGLVYGCGLSSPRLSPQLSQPWPGPRSMTS